MSSSDHRAGFWGRLFGRRGGERDIPPPPPPLFPLRPVPPPPAGPGLPAWDEILSAAPPPPDPGPDASFVPDIATEVAAAEEAKRPPTEEERQALAEIGALLSAAQPERAAALLDATFRERPAVCDVRGRPVYLLESLHCALLLGETDAAADRARRLRPHLAAGDPVIEVLYAQAAVAAGDIAAARANWREVLARVADHAEARAWLAAHPGSSTTGTAVLDLLGADGTEIAARIQSPPSLAEAPAAAAELPDWVPARLLAAAALTVGADGMAQAASGGTARPLAGASPNDLALVFRHPDGLGRAATFAEIALAAFVVQRQFLPHLRPARLYVGRQAWAVPGPQEAAQGSAQAEIAAVLFPGIRVIADHDGALRETQALVVDGALRNAATGTLIGGMMPQVGQWAAEARARVHAACGLPNAAEPPRYEGRRPRVLYLHAAPPRTLAEPVRERLFSLFTGAGYDVVMADLATVPWHRQVRLAYGADIVTGAHGPAFGVVLWAHPQTRVLEFFPEGTRRYDGQLLAEAAGLAYLGLEGVTERGFVIHARERWGPPVGRANRLVWALPWTMLEQALAVPKGRPPAP